MSEDPGPKEDREETVAPHNLSSNSEPNASELGPESSIPPPARRNAWLIQRGLKHGLIPSDYADWMLKQESDWESRTDYPYNAEYDIALQQLFKRTNAPASAEPIYQKAHLRIPPGIEVYSVGDSAIYYPGETMPLSDFRWVAARSRDTGGYRDTVSFSHGAAPVHLAWLIDNGALESFLAGRSPPAFTMKTNFNRVSYSSLFDNTSKQVETVLRKLAMEDYSAHDKARKWWNQRSPLFESWPRKQTPHQDFNVELELLTAVDRMLYPLLESRWELSQRVQLELARYGEQENPSKSDQKRISKLSELQSMLNNDIILILENRSFAPLNQTAGKLLGGGRDGFLNRLKRSPG